MSEWSSTSDSAGSDWSTAGTAPAGSGAADQSGSAWDSAVETVEEAWDATVEQVEQTWDELTEGAEDGTATEPDAGADFRVKSDFELRAMAGAPPEAAAAWPGLDEGSRARVLEYMGGFYGADFAQQFATTPTDLSHHYDSIRNLAPSRLEAMGYRYGRTEGNEQIYYHPSGQTYHLKVFFNGDDGGEPEEGEDPSADPVSPCDEAEPVMAARDWADFLLPRTTRLPADLAECERLVGQAGYAEAYGGLVSMWNEFDNNLGAAEGGFAEWRDSAEDCAVAVEAQIDRIMQAREWQQDFSPEFWSRVGRLPSP